MKMIILVLALAAIGCGAAPLDVEGEWQSPINGFNCARLLAVNGDGTFNLGLICTLQNNAVAMEVHRGTYTAVDHRLSLDQTRSSCPGDVKGSRVFDYSRTAGNLTLVDNSGALIFVPIAPGPANGGAIQLGCFDASLTFAASPEHAVF